MNPAVRAIGLPLVLMVIGSGAYLLWERHVSEDGCGDVSVTSRPAKDLEKERDQVDDAIFSLRDASTPETVKVAAGRLITMAESGHVDAAVELARTFDKAAESGDANSKDQARRWRCAAYRLGSPKF